MKTATTLLVLLTVASSALAHSAAAPHTHHGSHISWVPALACIAALATAIYLGIRYRKHRKSR